MIRAARSGGLRPLLVHLRLHFQLLLAPLFLWGYLLGGGRPDARLVAAFLAFHVFLYGGTTAFNSAYDRDEGPVGGLYAPPPPPPLLLPFSLAVQAIGALLAALVSPATLLVYLAMAALGAAYSHPALRWKASPMTALPTIAVGQGALGFLAGLTSAAGGSAAPGWQQALGALSAAMIVTGFYSLSSLFQLDEDRRRGDRTVAVAWGPGAAFALALGCFLAAAPLLALVGWARYDRPDALALAGGMLLVVVAVLRWRRRFDPAAVRANYLAAMQINALAAGAFSAYLLARIALRGLGLGG
jgi:1,4-dihydroxy-2-naphthoate octaprenyltransferase